MHQLFIDFKKTDESVRKEVLYNINPKTLVRLIKMCQNENYSTVLVGKHLSDIFLIRNGLKGGDSLSPLVFNFAVQYAIRRVQVNQDGLKFNGKHQLLFYVDDNTLGRNLNQHTIMKNTGALVAASKEIGLDVNADTTKYMVMSQDQNEGQSHIIKT